MTAFLFSTNPALMSKFLVVVHMQFFPIEVHEEVFRAHCIA